MEKNNNQKQNKYKKYKIYIIVSVLILIFSIGIALFYLSINKKPYNKNTNMTIKTSTPAPTQPEPRENEKIVLWEDIVNEWINGEPLQIPVDYPFYYKPSVCTDDMKSEYIPIFDKAKNLPLEQDYSQFIKHINKHINDDPPKLVICFESNSGNLLVVPMPDKDKVTNTYKNFATIQLFMNNAENKQKIAFWKKVGEIIKTIQTYDKKSKITVNTDGHVVPYFHLRIVVDPIGLINEYLTNNP